MNTLELKHIAPYLPYDVKVRSNIQKGITYVLNSTIIRDYSRGEYDIMPILNPMINLMKNEFHMLRHTIIMNSKKKTFDSIISGGYGVNDLPYHVVVLLLKNHFDVFGLIEKGLAIDINTTNQ